MPHPRSQFDPADLLSEASLNRTVIPDTAPFPTDCRGASGFDLLSWDRLADVPPPPSPDGVQSIASRLAALIAALVRDDDGAAGRGVEPTPWRLAYLRHWQQIEEVWIGGGGAARLGPDLAAATSARLADYDVAVTVRLPEHPHLLPLIGVARTTPVGCREAVVLDFGHSLVKRGVVEFGEDGAVSSLSVRPPLRVATANSDPPDVVRFVGQAIERSLAERPAATEVACAIAAYVTPEGVPSDTRGYYAPLSDLAGAPAGARFVHDGTAAAAAIDTTARAAVIMLGTALGVGFVTRRWRRSMPLALLRESLPPKAPFRLEPGE